jgi:hypothetical protein
MKWIPKDFVSNTKMTCPNCCNWIEFFVLDGVLTPKIPSPFLPISTSKMLKFSKKSQKKKFNFKIL